jgi:hypothetical protein
MSVATLLDNTLRPPRQLVILQSSNAQSALPLLRSLIASDPARQTTILCCALHPPSALRVGSHLPNRVIAVDLTTYVPGYGGGIAALGEKVNKAVEEGEYCRFAVISRWTEGMCKSSASRSLDGSDRLSGDNRLGLWLDSQDNQVPLQLAFFGQRSFTIGTSRAARQRVAPR